MIEYKIKYLYKVRQDYNMNYLIQFPNLTHSKMKVGFLILEKWYNTWGTCLACS